MSALVATPKALPVAKPVRLSRVAPRLLWLARTGNRVTGNVPTALVGTSQEESWESCEGCVRRDMDHYAYYQGLEAMACDRLPERNAVTPERFTLDYALANRHWGARVARLTKRGDLARVDRSELRAVLRKVRAAGLAPLGYTHF